jgi:hypothetical protein
VVNRVIIKHQSNRYCKPFSTLDELVTLLFGVFERCDSAREVCDGMAAMSGKLNCLGMNFAPAKSTFNDALNSRSEKVFDSIYFALLRYFYPLLSDSRKKASVLSSFLPSIRLQFGYFRP